MTAVSLVQHPARARRPPMRLALAGLAILAAAGLAADFRWSGAALRSQLQASAAELKSLPGDTPKAKIERTLAAAFAGRAVTVDAGGFPKEVTVTVGALDREACLAAEAKTRRIEGMVVTQLVGYRSAADCGDSNRMSWRLMP